MHPCVVFLCWNRLRHSDHGTRSLREAPFHYNREQSVCATAAVELLYTCAVVGWHDDGTLEMHIAAMIISTRALQAVYPGNLLATSSN